MGWMSYEIPDLEVKGRYKIKEMQAHAFSELCDAMIEVAQESEEEQAEWQALTDVLVADFEYLPDSVSAEALKQMIAQKDTQYLDFFKLKRIRWDAELIDSALDRLEETMLLSQEEAQSKLEDASSCFGDVKGEAVLISGTEDAYILLQMDQEGRFLPQLIEAYNDNYGSDYIPDAPDIFEQGRSPHRAFLPLLQSDEHTEYMAYRFILSQPEGSEEAREYAEYRDVFGPMRLEEVKVKLGEETFITASKNRRTDALMISFSRGQEHLDKTEYLGELATKHTQHLLTAKLAEWLSFFKQFHEALQFNLTESELAYLDQLAS